MLLIMKQTPSKILYNKLSQHYRRYSNKRKPYLETIDKLIINNLSDVKKVDILDVGCGDGVRGTNIFKATNGNSLTMIDNSPKMIKLAKQFSNQKIKVVHLDITNWNTLALKNNRYNVILCLWNVLGHIPTGKLRLQSLLNMKKLLKHNGMIFIDLSNRYNIKYYGKITVLKNIIKDMLTPSSNNGDFSYKLVIDDSIQLKTTSHFFNPFEAEHLFKETKLKIKNKYFVNYQNGNLEKFFWQGHLFYILSK